MSQLDPEELRRQLARLAESSPEAAAEVERVLRDEPDPTFSVEETEPPPSRPELPDVGLSLEETVPSDRFDQDIMRSHVDMGRFPGAPKQLDEPSPPAPIPPVELNAGPVEDVRNDPDMEFSLDETAARALTAPTSLQVKRADDVHNDPDMEFSLDDTAASALTPPISLKAGRAKDVHNDPDMEFTLEEAEAPDMEISLGEADAHARGEEWKEGAGAATLLDEPPPSPPQPIAVHKQSWRERAALDGQGPPRGKGEDGPPREGSRGKDWLLAIMSGLASSQGLEGAANDYRSALHQRRAARRAAERAGQSVSPNERALLGLDGELTRGELDFAAKYGWKPGAGGDGDSARWENARLDRESKEKMAEDRNKSMLEAARIKAGKGRRGGGGGPGATSKTSEARAIAIMGREGYEKLKEDYAAYQRGSAEVDTMGLQERLIDAYGEKAGLRMFGGAKGDHTTNTLTERGQRNNYEKQVEKLKYAMVASRKLSALAQQVSQGGQNMKRYSAALDELASQKGAGGLKGDLSEDASNLREAVVFMMGQIASTKGGAALTESEFSRLGGGTRVWQLGYGKEDQEFSSFWNMRGFGDGLSGKALAVANGSLTGADIHRFIRDVPKLLEEIRKEGMKLNPTGASADYRAGYTGMSKERVEEYILNANPDIDDEDDIEVIGPIEGTSKAWRWTINGEERTQYLE